MNLQKKILPIALALFGLVGCSSQGKLTHAVFEQPDASFRELDLSLKELYLNIHEGSTDDQYKAVHALRHLAKWAKDPAKRALAAKGLVFTAAFASDGDVVDAADSRVRVLLRGEDLALANTIIEAKVGVVTGHFGLLVTNTSFFSSDVSEEFLLADDDEREDALDFLVSNFDQVEGSLQLPLAYGFAEILSNPAHCYEKGFRLVTRTISETVPNPMYQEPKEGEAPVVGVPKMITKNKIVTEEDRTQSECHKDDGADQASWKEDLIEEIKDMLSYGGVKPEVSTVLLLAVANTQGLEDRGFVAGQLAEWVDESVLGVEQQPVLEAALNRAKGYYPDLVQNSIDQKTQPGPPQPTLDGRKSATEIARELAVAKGGGDGTAKSQVASPFKVRPNYTNPGAYLGLAFWVNNSDMILQRQLFLANSRYRTGGMPENQAGFLVPLSWLNYRGFDGSPEMNALKITLFQSLSKALAKGYRFDSPGGLTKVTLKGIKDSYTAPTWDVVLQMQVLAGSWPSLQKGGVDYQQVEQAIVQGIEQHQGDAIAVRAYVMALVSGLNTNKSHESSVCEIINTHDVEIQLAAFDQVQTFAGYQKPDSKDSLLPSPTFCGVPLYGEVLNKPKTAKGHKPATAVEELPGATNGEPTSEPVNP